MTTAPHVRGMQVDTAGASQAPQKDETRTRKGSEIAPGAWIQLSERETTPSASRNMQISAPPYRPDPLCHGSNQQLPAASTSLSGVRDAAAPRPHPQGSLSLAQRLAAAVSAGRTGIPLGDGISACDSRLSSSSAIQLHSAVSAASTHQLPMSQQRASSSNHVMVPGSLSLLPPTTAGTRTDAELHHAGGHGKGGVNVDASCWQQHSTPAARRADGQVVIIAVNCTAHARMS